MSADPPQSGEELWADAALAAALLAVDPVGAGGISLRGPPGPVRDAWLAQLRGFLPPLSPWRRAPLHVADGRLLGGLDLAATVSAGRPVIERGLLAEADGGILLLAMAERVTSATAARLAAAMDRGQVVLERDGIALQLPARFACVALDEGLDEDEMPPSALTERLAFRLDLSALRADDTAWSPVEASIIMPARALLPQVRAGEQVIATLCAAAAALGIDSMRAPLLALRVARAVAALGGRDEIGEEDVMVAARLVLAPRATRMPAPPSQEGSESPPPPAPEPEQALEQNDAEGDQGPLEDSVIAAAQSVLPPSMLDSLTAAVRAAPRPRETGRSGAPQTSSLRGRPIGARPGVPRSGARLDLVETLRAAAPWQTLRRAQFASPHRVEVRSSDFRVRRYRRRSQTTTIFAVDASGSSAMHRLAEAKGAVELLLADCYVRRDRVALVAFRGGGAEVLLPPTRSLARAKRCLSALPGGGGTPLAAGIDAAAGLADTERRGGGTAVVVLLTDARPNVASSGAPGRPEAERDARAAARRLRAAGHPALLVDTSPRPNPLARELATEMGSAYLALPRADAAGVSRAALALGTSAAAQAGRR